MKKVYDDKKFIGNIIRNARKAAGLNQAQLAEKLGMSDKNLGNIENGKQFPQVNNFFRIIEELNINVSEFGVKPIVNTIKNTQKENLFKLFLTSPNDKIEIYTKFIKLINETYKK